ncbi:hypothetical protein [Moorena producens]|uniref:hypothetical protein n=1 Tax=Moorena producens TaxID=1155739 RepID=UPI003C782983
MVAVHLDALYLESDRLVVEAMADFSRLPYFDDKQDVNSNIANISEEIVSQPFQNQNLYLKAGIHLHWALPDALTKGIQVTDDNKQTQTVFPVVPNRWLVTRSNKDNQIEKQWVVESDYLYPEGKGSQVGSIAYPIEVQEGKHQPFRYLGRKVPLAAWQENDSNAKYLRSLTAVGYGEPTFAAFYPNCHSVFGFYDDEYSAEIPDGLQYEVIGWYSDAEQDYFHQFIQKLQQPTNYELLKEIQEEFQWAILVEIKKQVFLDEFKDESVWKELITKGWLNPLNEDTASINPKTDSPRQALAKEFQDKKQQIDKLLNTAISEAQILCYARLQFASKTDRVSPDKQASVEVTVGNTGTEALSAYLGQKIDSNYKSIIEDQLEALHLSSRLEHQPLDITPKFKEARHEKGFNAIAAGMIWTIRLESVGSTTANAKDAHHQAQVTLPDDLAHLLNKLNLFQQYYDRAWHEIESMRRQLFADWYKYMLSAYPPEGSRDEYPDIDEVKHYIKEKGIAPLQTKLRATGNLTLLAMQGDESGKLVSAKAEVKDSSVISVASLLAENINNLLKAIAEENINLCNLKVSDIRDWQGFISKLQSKEEPIERIKGLIPDLESKIEQQEQAEIIEVLKSLLKRRDFYQEDVFNSVPEVQALLQNKPDLIKCTEEELVRFNRQLLEASFPGLILKVPHPYILRQISSPRYWQPKEPVLLMTGEAVKPTIRHGQDGRLRDDGLLECEILKDVTIPIGKKSFPDIRNKIDKLEQDKTGEHIAFSNREQQPWHPFLLEWEVEVFPIREGCNHRTYNSNYDNEFITSNYGLKENEADLSLQSGKGAILKAANVYSGRSILTPHAGIKLKEELEVYLKKQLPDKQLSADLSNNIQKIREWYETKPETEKQAKDPIYTAIRAYQKLLTLNSLSQSLGGFNEALLMHKQTLQLPIADPLGFADYQPFTEEVRDIVQQSIRSAPEPLNDFNPIRSGAMKILRLRLVDTFGQVKELDVSNIITTEQMTTPGSSYLVTLPPRLVQPARLNFRWLSASQGEQEMNSHPATTPICGWVLPNNLDNSLAIYDNLGKALGSIRSINNSAEWESAPGSSRQILVDDIPNPYLKRVVNYIVDPPQPPLIRGESVSSLERGESVSFIDNFISALDSGLENIDPENFAQHQGLALLMGRPIAVVRASLNLELQGFPSVNQDWNVFWQDLRRNSRDTDGFDQVKFPIRLGEYHQFNDGLVGYWQEEEEDGLSKVFYAPQSDSNGINDPQIKFHPSDNPWHLDVSLEDKPKLLTMLIDPRGKVHATCGILPTKAIDIPPDQYQEALEKIEITFLSTPILTDLRDLSDPTLDKKINLPLPGEPGYEWSWLEKEKEEWLTVTHDTIGQVTSNAVFSGQQAIREGWLKLSPASTNQD